MKTMAIAMLFLVVLFVGCDSSSQAQARARRDAERQAIWDAQLAKSGEQLIRADKEADGWEALLAKQENQAERFDRILTRWELLLDRLESRMSASETGDAAP